MEYLTFVKGLNIFSGMSSGDVLACVIIGIIALVVGLIIAFPVVLHIDAELQKRNSVLPKKKQGAL